MNEEIFISHSSADKPLVEKFVDLLQTGINIRAENIFCASLEGLGIPPGKNFIEYIKSKIINPKVVIFILTKNFYSREFCLIELGATWALSNDIIPIIVPPLTIDDVKGVLSETQLIDITNKYKLNEFFDTITKLLNISEPNIARWEVKRDGFLKELENILSKIQYPQVVKYKDYTTILAKYEQSKEEITKLNNEIERLNLIIKDLKKIKNKNDVKTVLEKYTNKNSLEQFKEIVEEIKSLLSDFYKPVAVFILSDYYGKPKEIDWWVHREDFQKAMRYNIILEDEKVNWENRKMKDLDNLLNKLYNFISGADSDFHTLFSKEYGIDLEPDNQEFWEKFYL